MVLVKFSDASFRPSAGTVTAVFVTAVAVVWRKMMLLLSEPVTVVVVAVVVTAVQYVAGETDAAVQRLRGNELGWTWRWGNLNCLYYLCQILLYLLR